MPYTKLEVIIEVTTPDELEDEHADAVEEISNELQTIGLSDDGHDVAVHIQGE